MDKEAVVVTARLITRASVRNNFYLAKTEFRELNNPPPLELLRNLGKRLHVLGCPEDPWMSRAQFQELLSKVQGIQVCQKHSVTLIISIAASVERITIFLFLAGYLAS